MENFVYLPKDINNLCLSYLSKDEQLYISKKWEEYDKDYVCFVAIQNDWLDLLIWAKDSSPTFGNNCSIY